MLKLHRWQIRKRRKRRIYCISHQMLCWYHTWIFSKFQALIWHAWMIILKQSCEVVIRMCVGVFLSRSYRILVMSATITKVFKLDKLLSQRGCSNFCTNPTGMGSAQASAGSRLGVCGYSDSSDRTSTLRRQAAKWTSHHNTADLNKKLWLNGW